MPSFSNKQTRYNYLISIPVKTIDKLSLEPVTVTVAASSVTPYTLPSVTTFKHRTFIKKNQIHLWLDGNCYNGDGATRGYSATSGSHKTSFGIDIVWTDRTYTLIRDVGETRQYDDGPNTVAKANFPYS